MFRHYLVYRDAPTDIRAGKVMADNLLLQILARLLDTEDAAVAVKDVDGRYLFANPGYAQFIGLEAGQIVGRKDHAVLPAERATSMRIAHETVRDSGNGVQLTDQDAGYLLTHFPVVDEAARLVAIGVVAINAAKTLRDFAELEQALESANRANTRLQGEVDSLDRLASTDRLTHAWNRQRFEEAIEGEIHRAVRFGHPVSIAMVDIDHFKQINDTFGHPVGDRVLAEFADCVREMLRRSDSFTRWGGEEFVILMPNTPLGAARLAAERVRAHLEAHRFADVPVVTASFGVAEFAPMESMADLLTRADDAMYRAKEKGRNCVEVDVTPTHDGQLVEHVEGNFVQLSWKPAFESGHPLLDAQHRELFELSNQLLAAVVAGRPKDEVSGFVDELIERVLSHFRDEERVLADAGFEALESHGAAHARLTDRALELADAFRADRLSVGELFEFLAYDVVARHMLGADRQYVPWINNR